MALWAGKGEKMNTMHSLKVLARPLILLAAVLFLSSCAETPIAPAFNLYGYHRLAVIPFDNNTQDPALAKAVQDEMVQAVLNLNAVPVIDAAQVAAYLKSIKANAADVSTDEGLRRKIAAKFKCDVMMIGACEGYNEFLKDEAPQRLANSETGAVEWGFYTDRKVVVDTSAKLMDADSGSLVWTQKGNGYSWFNTWNPLPIPASVVVPDQIGSIINLANLVNNRINKKSDKEPLALDGNPDGGLIYPKSSAFAELRGKAVYQSVNSMVKDFRGFNGWTPGMKLPAK
jgi:hypothetical protein